MCKLKCCFKDLTYFLKLNNLQRELMQHCLEEGSKGGKAYNSQSSNGSNQGGMELYNRAWYAEVVAAVW